MTFRLLLFITAFPMFLLAVAKCQTPAPTQSISPQDRVREVIKLLATPFDIYGRVLDENHHPVGGATVHITVSQEAGTGQETTEHEEISDQSGNFSILGLKGEGVFISASKDGYYTLPNGNVGGYGLLNGQLPTKDNPAIFPLQKKGVAEPVLLIGSKHIHFAADGSPLSIHLRRGGPVDLVAIFTSDKHDDKAHVPFKWSLNITVPGGGICIRSSPYAFMAPSGIYPASLDITEPTVGDQWTDTRTFECFAKLGDGKYARFRISFDAFYRMFSIENGYINPSGSPNLEYDPAKRIR